MNLVTFPMRRNAIFTCHPKRSLRCLGGRSFSSDNKAPGVNRALAPEGLSLSGFIILTLLLLTISSSAFAQAALPNSFSGWTSAGAHSFTPTDATALAIAKEYDFVSAGRATYTHGAGTLDVTLYRMKDPSGAYGEYSYLRQPDMARADLSEHSSMSSNRALALAGNLVLDARAENISKLAPALKALITNISNSAVAGPLPWIGGRLPTDNMVLRSDHYILGPVALNQFLPLGDDDWLGFSHGAEAETAQYQLGGKTMTLLLADFPTPQIAQDELSRLGAKFNVNGSHVNGATPLFAKRTVTMLEVVYGAGAKEEAAPLLNGVESGTQVTWSEPTYQFKEPSIEVMIVGSIIGTGVICVFTIVAGLAFGGFRLVVKRAFPNKVFDRNTQIQVLQLGLSSKPINAEDFYSLDGTSIPNPTVDKHLPDRVALRIFR
jgi:hypothetical protein